MPAAPNWAQDVAALRDRVNRGEIDQMAFHFRKSFRLLPGLRLNLGRRGVSASLGPRAANLNIDKKGLSAKGGIPGTGLSAHHRLTGGRPTAANQPARKGLIANLLGRFLR